MEPQNDAPPQETVKRLNQRLLPQALVNALKAIGVEKKPKELRKAAKAAIDAASPEKPKRIRKPKTDKPVTETTPHVAAEAVNPPSSLPSHLQTAATLLAGVAIGAGGLMLSDDETPLPPSPIDPLAQANQRTDYAVVAAGENGRVLTTQRNTRTLDANDLPANGRNVIWIARPESLPEVLTIDPLPDTLGKKSTQITTLAIEASVLEGKELRVREFPDSRMNHLAGAENATSTVIDVCYPGSSVILGSIVLPGQGGGGEGTSQYGLKTEQPGIASLVITNNGVPQGAPIPLRNVRNHTETQQALNQAMDIVNGIPAEKIYTIPADALPATFKLTGAYLGTMLGMHNDIPASLSRVAESALGHDVEPLKEWIRDFAQNPTLSLAERTEQYQELHQQNQRLQAEGISFDAEKYYHDCYSEALQQNGVEASHAAKVTQGRKTAKVVRVSGR